MFSVVMEYCAGGDLSQLIADRKDKRIKGSYNALLDQSFIIKVFHQLLMALKELHNYDQVKKKISKKFKISKKVQNLQKSLKFSKKFKIFKKVQNF